MLCPKCGYQNSSGSTYCAHCGSLLDSNNHNGQKIAAIIITACVVVVALMVILLASGNLFRSDPSLDHYDPGSVAPKATESSGHGTQEQEITPEESATVASTEQPAGKTEPTTQETQESPETSAGTQNKLKYPISEEVCYIIYRNYFGYEMKAGEDYEVVVQRYGVGDEETLAFAIYRINSYTGGYTIRGLFCVHVNTGKCVMDDEIVFQADNYYSADFPAPNSPTESEQMTKKFEPMIDAGNYHSVYLREDGTVAAVGSNKKSEYANRGLRCDVSGWTDIVEISAASHTVGLRSDGSVVATGVDRYGQCSVGSWKNIVAINAGDYHTLGLRSDGTVVAVGYRDFGQCDVSGWRDIIQVSAGAETSYGLQANGTVVAVGSNSSGQRNVSAWSDITAISAGIYYVVGLKSNGTVVTAGISEQWKDEYSAWTDIVAISAGSTHMVGLKADGTVVACGRNDKGQCNVSGWTDISSVSVGMYFTIGMKSDGTLIATGDNSYGQLGIVDCT